MTIRQWRPFRIIADNASAYMAANVAVYGVLLVGFGLGLAFPQLSQAQHRRLQEDGTADLVQGLITNPWLFALTILAVNTLRMGVLTIVAPSLVIPFGGVAFFAYWDVTTGMTLVPASGIGWVALIPHTLTVIVELQAYLLLLLGAFLLGRGWVAPRTVDADNRRQGYVRGLQELGWLALPALVLLVVGAVYEAFSLRYVVHPLADWLL
ncbi:stage II sporulation protein M [Mycolicibacterium aichiense]|uniref:Stage II sporulation protein M n=1 Tax=Mycolicibacterium aichiense TaxID=1799 RepID=A0AAD1MCM4_9MYCO|nr:stage II sporulation protein M [Mycolicibacterium aichiense]MCV7020410.1 stage II sporulation protein M [Mycolicibacterium aichiense]BBX07921.1 hypothetical protein MAIC_27240 [Mycolicibacterium aichiense]STZ81731.1 Uncharacterised protein [Mycolicibacterium aichiense]